MLVTFLPALSALLVRAGYVVGRLRPIHRNVVLATATRTTLGGNLAWIAAGIERALPGAPVVTLAYRRRGGRALIALPWHLVRTGYHLATARLSVVDDYFFPMYVVPRRPGTRFVQVWHACGAFKKFGYSVLDRSFGASESYVRSVPIHSTYDLCLVSAERFIPAYMEAFRLPRDRFTARLGIPRTDLFFDGPGIARTAAALRARYRIPEGKRVILYAPTFRGERTTEARDPTDLDLDALRASLAADHVVLLRSHPFVRPGSGPAADGEFVIDVSAHPDMNELMLVSDVLVTDYSSAIYEFALLGRPIAFFAPDRDAYERERGLYFDYATGVPGPVFTDSRALADWFRAGVFDTARVRAFAAESFDVADGAATARFVDEIVASALL